jgi:RecG-like helicase
MGLRDLGKRLKATVEQLDDERLQERFAGLQLSKISEVEPRQPMRVGGEVQRVRITPRSGVPTFEITVCDGTGDMTAVFTGRRHLAGIEHNRAIILEGVARTERGRTVVLNPAYTLLPAHAE